MASDKGYRFDWIDEFLLALDRDAYGGRKIAERIMGWLKECRRIFFRFEKTAKNFGGMLKMAFVRGTCVCAAIMCFRQSPALGYENRTAEERRIKFVAPNCGLDCLNKWEKNSTRFLEFSTLGMVPRSVQCR
jgi:hypothetical protein